MRSTLRRLARRLPPQARDALHRLASIRRLRRRMEAVQWGNLRRTEPRSRSWGTARGTPIDRYYIDRFFREHAEAIAGRVLEVRDPRYADSLGKGVTSIDIVDIDARNDTATIVCDIGDSGSLPPARFDCVIVPQTLVYVRDPVAAVANLWQSLAPGGTLLISNPAIARLDSAAINEDRWHLSPAGLREVMLRGAPDAQGVSIAGHGNILAAVAFLHGIAQEELSSDELDVHDDLYPVVVTALARKA